jgi:preprotein translocase SecF subunit
MRFPFVLVPHETNINFIGVRWVAFIFSLIITVGSIVSLFTHGLNFGIDFTGGVIIEARTDKVYDIAEVRELLSDAGYEGANIQNFGSSSDLLIRLQPRHTDDQAKEIASIKSLLESHFNNGVEFRRVDFVGPKVGQELIQKGITAVIISLIGMSAYIAFRFNWQFGIGVIVALFHDAIATIGFYVITQYEFDLYSIAAILTIVGYSINDTVVIYDRIRENLRKYKVDDIEHIINLSVNETLSRTIMTVSTTLLVCLALVLFGGEVIKGFSMAMFFGIAFGTYSSVYIAAPILMHTGFKKIVAKYKPA